MTTLLKHPSTALVDYNEEELIFLRALDNYKRRNQRLYPTWREVLAVVHSLGYRKVEESVELPKFDRGAGKR